MASAKANKYRELREARGMTVGDLSHRLGVDEATIHRWESGEQEPEPASLAQWADAVGVSQDELRHAEDRRHHPVNDE